MIDGGTDGQERNDSPTEVEQGKVEKQKRELLNGTVSVTCSIAKLIPRVKGHQAIPCCFPIAPVTISKLSTISWLTCNTASTAASSYDRPRIQPTAKFLSPEHPRSRPSSPVPGRNMAGSKRHRYFWEDDLLMKMPAAT
nr:hypothetical protein CFP56_63069 [Quercus suber]